MVDEVPDCAVVVHEGLGVLMLFWRDWNLKFHSYADRLAPVGELLDYVDSGVDPIVFG